MILLDYSQQELIGFFPDQKPYKVRQLYKWLTKGVDFEGMTDIDKAWREKLSAKHIACPVRIFRTFESKDGTKKFLYRLSDGNLIEGVLMSYHHGNTLCVSTQVGCRMGCAFCASTLDGLVRNLSAGEILGQVTAVNAFLGGDANQRRITNIVLMGSGEPLDNFDNTVKFLDLVSGPDGLNVSQRNISLSTCGIAPKMIELADRGYSVNLTLSLHSPRQEKRRNLMPISNAYPLTKVIEACKYYFLKTGRRVIFEYVLVKGENDSDEDARLLSRLTRGFSAHVNLIRLNPVKERKLLPTEEDAAREFLAKLTKLGVSATIRRQMGVDIEGACGQLRRRVLKNGKD